MFNRRFIFSLLILISVILLPKTLSSQETKNFIGPLKVGQYSGKAEYQYQVSDQDTIYNGSFQLQRSSLEALLDKEDLSFLFKGNFSKGKPNGLWRIQFGTFQSNSQTKVVDYEYRVLISGTQEEGLGKLTNGKPHGNWTYEVNQIKDSEVEKPLFKSEINFDNGVPQQNFQIENENSILVGRFLRNGLAHDEWTSFDVATIANTESWFFEEGLLKKIQIIENGKSKDIPVFDYSAKEFETINFDDNYLEVLQTTIAANIASFELNGNFSGLLSKNSAYYQKVDSILSQLGTADFKPNFKVQVPYYQIDSVQNDHLQIVKSNFKTADSISNYLLHNSQLSILKRSNVDALFYYNTIAQISESYLKPMATLISFEEKEILPYVNLEKFLMHLWPNGKPAKRIKVVIDSAQTLKAFELPNADTFSFDGNNFSMVRQLSEYAKQTAVAIQNSLSNQLATEERQQALVLLEENLVVKDEQLILQIDSLSAELPLEYRNGLQNIKNHSENALIKYAAMEDEVAKLTFGKSLVTCFEQLVSLSTSVAKLPEQSAAIDSLYQDSVFNPFMSVVMQEEVKKRLTSAYQNVLIPYFVDQTTHELNCENVIELNNDIIQSYERMVILREADTKKLERKLRREEDPKIIMQLIHVQPKTEDQ